MNIIVKLISGWIDLVNLLHNKIPFWIQYYRKEKWLKSIRQKLHNQFSEIQIYKLFLKIIWNSTSYTTSYIRFPPTHSTFKQNKMTAIMFVHYMNKECFCHYLFISLGKLAHVQTMVFPTLERCKIHSPLSGNNESKIDALRGNFEILISSKQPWLKLKRLELKKFNF